MLTRLRQPKDEFDDPRAELDTLLEVAAWWTPLARRYDESNVPSGAPTWWRGDEEATDTFLRGMGVTGVEQLRR